MIKILIPITIINKTSTTNNNNQPTLIQTIDSYYAKDY